MKTKLSSILCILALLLVGSTAYSVTFDFNDGTNQDWTYNIYALDTDTDSDRLTLLSSGSTGWSDTNNYPNPMITDPIGDNQGSASLFLSSWIGTQLGPADDWVFFQFVSSDLSGMADWRNINSFSAQVLPASSGGPFIGPFYANLLYVVDDYNTGTERTFHNGVATELTEGDWNMREFTDIQSTLADAGVVRYITKRVVINLWVEKGHFMDKLFALDLVQPASIPSLPWPYPVLQTQTCKGLCGRQSKKGGCWCDDACRKYGDCCPDYYRQCGRLPGYKNTGK